MMNVQQQFLKQSKRGSMNEKQTVYNCATARAEFTKILDRAAAGERVPLSKYNIPRAAMVSISDLELLERLESEKNKNGKK
ncbi:type II toxin-antitoxin system prevent-host-death family antitoxin [bacterium]|nr:type II toxin-antitoxin system prevent-host-death family antitoxin [bacterium]